MKSWKRQGIIWVAFLLALALGIGLAWAQDPGNQVLLEFRQGMELARQGQFAEAKESFTRALRLDPFHRPSFNALRVVEDVLKKRIQPETGRHLFQGDRYKRELEYEAAIGEYTRAIARDPNYAEAYNSRGLAYKETRQYDLAIADLTRAMELDPQFAVAYYHRALTYEVKGDLHRAIADYSKAVELDPKYYMAWANKGDACEKVGRKKEAIEAYRNFLKYAPPRDKREIELVRKRLRVLEGTPGQ